MISKILDIFLLTLVLFISPCFAQDKCFVTGFPAGETTIHIEQKCYNPCNSKITFLNLHDNEKTSVRAAEEYLLQNGGTIIRIYNRGQRNVSFKLKNKVYTFDPNRIYSEDGRRSTIKFLSNRINEDAENEVAYLANEILNNYVDSSKIIIALHNNTDSNLSVLSYQREQETKINWGKVFINPFMDPDEFILTTDSVIFNGIKEKNINAVWENVDSIRDDGSLSIYAARNKIPYLNVEAQHEHLDEQCAMLTAVQEIIKEYGKEKGETKGDELPD
ncbi:MAG: hypothetical protein JWQ40_200 [Segetibacter sp.]|nr:hypothetical protein [Segetibacter sp.]